LAQVADKVGLTSALSLRLGVLKQRRRGHDPGWVIRDLAVMLANGGECVSDLAGQRDQEALFGSVASNAAAFRVSTGSRQRRGCWTRSAPRMRERERGSGRCTACRPSQGSMSTRR